MKKMLFFLCLLPMGMQLWAQPQQPPYTRADMGYKGPVKTVTTYYEDIINGMPYTKVEQFNRQGFLVRRSVNGEMRNGTKVYHFDNSNRLTSYCEYSFDSTISTLVYDKKGCVVRATVINYTEEGEIEYDTTTFVNRDDCKPKSINGQYIFTYDKNGRVVSMKNGDWICEYTYDAAGNLVCENTNRGEFVSYYVYDKRGLCIHQSDFRGSEELKTRNYSYPEPFDKFGNWLKCSTTYPAEGPEEELATRIIEYY